jgi:hypothetical protein
MDSCGFGPPNTAGDLSEPREHVGREAGHTMATLDEATLAVAEVLNDK